MTTAQTLLNRLPGLRLSRLGDGADAGLWTTSLPWPRAAARALSLNGRPTYAAQLGQWPKESDGSPRRLLLAGDAGDARSPSPDQLALHADSPAPLTAPPTASAELFERCTEQAMMWERHLLRINWGGNSVGFAMGIRHAGEVHWWECARLVVLEETPTCRVVEMGGAIPRTLFGDAEIMRYPAYKNPFVHHHNWVNGHIYARLHANGVCEVFAHHINARFFDDGEHLADVVPVIGIATNTADPAVHSLRGPWDGQRQSLDLPGVRFDMAEVARLATPKSPGNIDLDSRFLILQPYEGVDLFSGLCGKETTGDPFLFRAKQHIFPRGMARTLRFSFSLNPQRGPRIVRYVAPTWWYGMCEEYSPKALLPVSNTYDRKTDSARSYVDKHIVRGGFEDGSVPRNVDHSPEPDCEGRQEAGWEGECPYAQFLMAWNSGDAAEFNHALRAAYYFTDVCIDHAAKLVRPHGYAPHALSLSMSRVQGSITAWLETGDPYLLNAALAVVDAANATQKNSWPRMAVGRDAKYLRSAILLYRYTGDEHYRKMALEGTLMVAQAQRPNGSFGDQAGGTGIHQRAAYVTKPWMGNMATECVLDYLELCGDEPRLVAVVERWADWLMKNRYRHDNGVVGWSYQHDFNGLKRHFIVQRNAWVELPTDGLWHLDSLARVLGFCALRDGDMTRIDAWAESLEATLRVGSDHALAASGQFIAWIQARLWNATLTADGVNIRPISFGPRTPRHATIHAPDGPIAVAWDADLKSVAWPPVPEPLVQAR